MPKLESSSKSGMFKKVFIGLFLLVLYLVSSVPVGLFLYSLKSEVFGVDVFSNTGFHSYMYCLQEQVNKVGEDGDDVSASETESNQAAD